MNPLLLAALNVATALGATINDLVRMDVQGQFTQVSITWPGAEAMTSYTEGFDYDEDILAMQILTAALAHYRPSVTDEP